MFFKNKLCFSNSAIAFFIKKLRSILIALYFVQEVCEIFLLISYSNNPLVPCELYSSGCLCVQSDRGRLIAAELGQLLLSCRHLRELYLAA